MKPLDKEQADWILAQCRDYGGQILTPFGEVCQLEKILNKCVNMVPEEGFKLDSKDGMLTICVTQVDATLPAQLVCISYEYHNNLCEPGSFSLYLDELKQHIDHCTKMLNFIEGKNE